MMLVIWLGAITLAWLRIRGVKSKSFQAIAHLFMGSLGDSIYFLWTDWVVFQLIAVFVGLSAIELGCFVFDAVFNRVDQETD